MPDHKKQNTNTRHKSQDLSGGSLFIVATPIGHLKDITFRAVETLKNVTHIACEDTRVTTRLLSEYGISTPMISYHEHNATRVRPRLLKALKEGQDIALVSDAGTPLISDPGYRLVTDAIAQDITVTSIPGPSASLTALTLSGLPTDCFFFGGFLPKKLEKFAAVPATLIFFESTRRLKKALQSLHKAFGNRKAVVARELTKKFEEIRRGSLEELMLHYENAPTPKGEIVLLIAPPSSDKGIDEAALDTLLKKTLKKHTVRDAVTQITAQTGYSRSKIYQRALSLRGE